MKNFRQGFASIILIVITFIAVGGGVYIYSKDLTSHRQQNTEINTELETASSSPFVSIQTSSSTVDSNQKTATSTKQNTKSKFASAKATTTAANKYKNYKNCGSVSTNSAGGSQFTDEMFVCLGRSIATGCTETIAMSGNDPVTIQGDSVSNCTVKLFNVDKKRLQCNLVNLAEEGTGKKVTAQELQAAAEADPGTLMFALLFGAVVMTSSNNSAQCTFN
jgi:hypothetical protein